jgi:hypothetical protein
MKQLKVALPDELRARLDAVSEKSGRSVAEEIRARVEESFKRAAVVDKPTRDFLEGLALIPAEIEREFGAAWDKHAGAHEYFTRVVLARLEVLKPKGSSEFGDRPHATLPLPTVLGRDPAQLGSIIENRLRQHPDFTTSAARRLMEDEYRRMQSALVGARERGQKPSEPSFNELLNQPKKGGKR